MPQVFFSSPRVQQNRNSTHHELAAGARLGRSGHHAVEERVHALVVAGVGVVQAGVARVGVAHLECPLALRDQVSPAHQLRAEIVAEPRPEDKGKKI